MFIGTPLFKILDPLLLPHCSKANRQSGRISHTHTTNLCLPDCSKVVRENAHMKQLPAYQTALRQVASQGETHTHTHTHTKQIPAYQTAIRQVTGQGEMKQFPVYQTALRQVAGQGETRAHIHTHTHAHAHTQTCTHTHTCTQTRRSTHTCTQTKQIPAYQTVLVQDCSKASHRSGRNTHTRNYKHTQMHTYTYTKQIPAYQTILVLQYWSWKSSRFVLVWRSLNNHTQNHLCSSNNPRTIVSYHNYSYALTVETGLLGGKSFFWSIGKI